MKFQDIHLNKIYKSQKSNKCVYIIFRNITLEKDSIMLDVYNPSFSKTSYNINLHFSLFNFSGVEEVEDENLKVKLRLIGLLE